MLYSFLKHVTHMFNVQQYSTIVNNIQQYCFIIVRNIQHLSTTFHTILQYFTIFYNILQYCRKFEFSTTHQILQLLPLWLLLLLIPRYPLIPINLFMLVDQYWCLLIPIDPNWFLLILIHPYWSLWIPIDRILTPMGPYWTHGASRHACSKPLAAIGFDAPRLSMHA